MVERKLYKTQICQLYRSGSCHRQSCSFAHGDSELRRFSASFNGRRDYQGGDLRDKIGRRGSPLRRFSLDRGAKDRQASHGYNPRSVTKRRDGGSTRSSDQNHRRNQQFDGENEVSGGIKSLDGTEDQVIDRKLTSSGSKDVHDEKLRKLASEIDMLSKRKHQLEIYLLEKVQESDSLTSKIEDLEIQLFKEKEECKRISSKIRKFIKEHNRHSKIQDDLKRSQDRLQKLADQLGTEALRSTNEEDASVNIVNDDETISPQTESLRNASPSRKRVRSHMVETREESKRGVTSGAVKRGKFSKWDPHLDQGNKTKEFKAGANRNNGFGQLASEDKSRKGKSIVTNIVLVNQMKDHAVDEVVEVVELDGRIEVENNASKGVAHDIPGVPFPLPPPPPPPLPRNVYPQYMGENKDVDVDGVDDEMVDVDIV